MADSVYEFFYRGFIEAEGRGNSYHVILEINGEHTLPLSPQQADKLGWPLSRIFEDLNAQTLYALDDARAQIDALQKTTAEAVEAKRVAEEKERGAYLMAQRALGDVSFNKAVPDETK